MKNKTLKKATALITSIGLATTMCGCNSFVSEDVAAYPLASAMTSAEVIDYYAKSLEYDSVITRNVDVHDTTYETTDIQGEKATKLKELAYNCEEILGKKEYIPTEDSLKLVSYDTFNYIKGVLDNEVLSNGKITNITGALGHYFVDIKYDISKKIPGSFNATTSLLGLNGAFYKDTYNNGLLDTNYMEIICKAMNKYFVDNSIDNRMVFDTNLQTLKTISSDAYDRYDINNIGSGDNKNTNDDTNENEGINTDTNEDVIETVSSLYKENEDDSNSNYMIITPMDRRSELDISLINKVVGSSLRQSAVMPNLSMVYNIPNMEGTISGYGIYTAGGNGLKTFGFDRNALEGTITLRYVFKDDSNGSGNIFGVNIYAIDEEITNGPDNAENSILVPDLLKSKLEQTIERADRVQVNNDLAGIMGGNIYEDMGFGVLRGFKNESTGIQKYMSTIRQVLNRNMENNSYLLEVETTIIEGPRDVDSYGTYKDKSLVVIQQQNEKFIITDWIRTMRTMVDEPSINPDSNIVKRLVALNLAGAISEDDMKSIKELLGELYTAGTNRVLRGPKDIEIDGTTYTINKGMYDCFSSDISILSADELEYENSTLRNALVKHGTNIQSIYKGIVTSWIGGYEGQAELTTEELVYYKGLNKGYYTEVYYLVSIENDHWVIDERVVLDEEEYDDEASLAPIKERIGITD